MLLVHSVKSKVIRLRVLPAKSSLTKTSLLTQSNPKPRRLRPQNPQIQAVMRLSILQVTVRNSKQNAWKQNRQLRTTRPNWKSCVLLISTSKPTVTRTEFNITNTNCGNSKKQTACKNSSILRRRDSQIYRNKRESLDSEVPYTTHSQSFKGSYTAVICQRRFLQIKIDVSAHPAIRSGHDDTQIHSLVRRISILRRSPIWPIFGRCGPCTASKAR